MRLPHSELKSPRPVFSWSNHAGIYHAAQRLHHARILQPISSILIAIQYKQSNSMIFKSVLASSVILCSSALANAVNSQVTDAITQTNVKVVGEAPAQSMGSQYQLQFKINNIINGCNAISSKDDRCACYKNKFGPLMSSSNDKQVLHSVVDQLCSNNPSDASV